VVEASRNQRFLIQIEQKPKSFARLIDMIENKMPNYRVVSASPESFKVIGFSL